MVIDVAAPAVLVRVNCAGGPTADAVTWKEPALLLAVTLTDANPLASVVLVAAESVPPGAVVVPLVAHVTVIFDTGSPDCVLHDSHQRARVVRIYRRTLVVAAGNSDRSRETVDLLRQAG